MACPYQLKGLTMDTLRKYGALIAAITLILCLFALNHNYGKMINSVKEDFKDSLDYFEERNNSDIKHLRQEVREMRETFQRWQEVLEKMETLDAPPSAGLFGDSDPNLYLDSVPCCGGEDNVTNFESIQSLPEDVSSFQEALAHVRANLPEEQRLQLEEMDRENEEFFSTLDEAGLADLERRKQEYKKKVRSQFTTLIAAMPEQVKQNWEKNKHIMEQSWEIAAHTKSLMDMRTDYNLPFQDLVRKLDMLKIEKNTASPPLTEEEWKMQEALRQLEEAARRQE